MTCASGTMTSVIAHPPSPLAPPVPTTPLGGENHINEITPACLAWCQAEKVIMVALLPEMRNKSPKESGAAQSVSATAHPQKSAVTLGSRGYNGQGGRATPGSGPERGPTRAGPGRLRESRRRAAIGADRT